MGSDGISWQLMRMAWGFNPRSRMGSDIWWRYPFLLDISFNPRSRMGSDYLVVLGIRLRYQFQSTLPHGERQKRKSGLTDEISFNPRSRMGSDKENDGRGEIVIGFNPRSRMGSDYIIKLLRVLN